MPLSRWNIASSVLLLISLPLLSQSRQTAANHARFEQNRGQFDSRAHFSARLGPYTTFLTDDGAVFVIHNPQRPHSKRLSPEALKDSGVAVNMRFKGANPHPYIRPQRVLPGSTSYLIGNDPHRWIAGVHQYSSVRYRDLYPGVDLVFHSDPRPDSGVLEYDFVVAPGIDPGKISFNFDGASSTNIDPEGRLVLQTAAGEIRHDKVVAYQIAHGHRQYISAHFVKGASDQLSFRVGRYDRSRALVVDPVLRYSTLLGGGGSDAGLAIASDLSGHAFVAGLTLSTDFPTTTGAFQRTAATETCFVSKFNFAGTRLLYSTFIGGASGRTICSGIKVDSAGNAYLTGFTEAPDFPTTTKAFQSQLNGTSDSFVTKLNASGTGLVYSTYLGGSADEFGVGISIDSTGSAYVSGNTDSTDFPTTSGAFQKAIAGRGDVFAAKLNPEGSALQYATLIGGTANDAAFGIAIDTGHNAYVGGYTTSSDFPVTAHAFQTKFGGGSENGDAFVLKLSPAGSALIYSTYIGGSADEGQEGHGALAIDVQGNAYITGDTFSGADFPVTPGAFQPSGACGPFVTKLNAAGTALAYSTHLDGGDGACSFGSGIAVDSAGHAFVTGQTGSVGWPLKSPFQAVLRGPFIGQGGSDAFVTEMNTTGTGLIYSSYLGGTGTEDTGLAITLDKEGNAYVTGTGSSSDFPTTRGSFQSRFNGGTDAFVVKVVPLCALSTAQESVTICAPKNGKTLRSPVAITAGTTDTTPVKLIQIYVDGKKQYEARLASAYVELPLTAGKHRITAQAFDTANHVFKQSVTVTVAP